MSEPLQHHIRCRPGDVGRIVLLPGDPARAESIARHLDGAREIARNREFLTFTGRVDGVPVSVTSTGIGGPSVAIAVEELVRVGADTLIRVGTGGAMQPEIRPGDLVVATAAVRDEGTARAYLPVEYPAVGSHDVTGALAAAASASGRPSHVGIVHTKDSFYGQKEPERMPVAERLRARWSAWVRGGVLLSEMETATLYVLASYLRVRAGSLCLVASNGPRRLQEGEELRSAHAALVECALAGVRRLNAGGGGA